MPVDNLKHCRDLIKEYEFSIKKSKSTTSTKPAAKNQKETDSKESRPHSIDDEEKNENSIKKQKLEQGNYVCILKFFG